MNLIDRDALIEKIRDEGILGNGYSDSEREDDVIDMIESCLTVDAAPVVHGRWIKHEDDWGLTYECSNCHALGTLYGNYCPNCGAKMDLEGTNDKTGSD